MNDIPKQPMGGGGPRPWVVGSVGLLFAVAVALRVLIPAGWDPSIFVAFGAEAEPTLTYGIRLLGDVDPRPELGHDGKFFFVQANDPLLLDPETNAAVLDRPTYRSQRMLYPLLAGGFGLLPPWGIVWGMLVLNVVALGVGTWGTAALARQMGGSSWWGLGFGLNLGLISELAVGGAGAVGFAFGIWGVFALASGRRRGAVALFCLAALSREALLLMALGAAIWSWREDRTGFVVLAWPTVAIGAWAVYVGSRLGWISGLGEIKEFGWPFEGFLSAVIDGRGGWFHPSVAVLVMIMGLLLALRVATRETLVGWATVGFVALAILFTRPVWLSYFDISRAVAPAITGFILVGFAGSREGVELLPPDSQGHVA